MQGFIILAIIGTEKLIVTKVDGRNDGRTDGRTEIRTPISHSAISRRDNNNNNNNNNRYCCIYQQDSFHAQLS